MGVSSVFSSEGWCYTPLCQRRIVGQSFAVREMDCFKNCQNLYQFRPRHVDRYPVPKTLLAPFHNIFHTWNSKPPLEPVLKENRAGDRGKKRKAQAKREGDCFLLVCGEALYFLNVIVCIQSLSLLRGGEKLRGCREFFFPLEWRGGKICAREGWWDDLLRQSKQDGFCSLKFDLTFDSTGLQRRKRLGA